MVVVERLALSKQPFQYNIDFDKGEADGQFISKQIEAHLRERFNVLISTARYEIVNGHLVREGTTEPFINSIKRGRDIIQRISLNTIDIDRENAEVTGFEDTIDPFMSNQDTPPGSKILSISPKGDEGSKYKHNFYDIFVLKEEGGERIVESSRYSSGLTPKEYAELLGFDPDRPPTVAAFLAKPIVITDISITSEQIHKALHKEHKYMDPAEFSEIWGTVQSFVRQYLLRRDGRSFNAILNFADEVWENNKRQQGKYRDYTNYVPSYEERRYLEEKEVRQVAGGCPGKSGADIDSSVFSVSEFSRGYSFDHEGICVVCKSGPKALGPCEICEECTIKIEKEEQLGQ